MKHLLVLEPRGSTWKLARQCAKNLLRALLVCTNLMSLSCSSEYQAYSGPARRVSEVAVIKGELSLLSKLQSEGVWITSVDGQREVGGWKAPTFEVHVLAGLREIGVMDAGRVPKDTPRESIPDDKILRFLVAPGGLYLVFVDETTEGYEVQEVGGARVNVTILEP